MAQEVTTNAIMQRGFGKWDSKTWLRAPGATSLMLLTRTQPSVPIPQTQKSFQFFLFVRDISWLMSPLSRDGLASWQP
jgi:hypothetical protein